LLGSAQDRRAIPNLERFACHGGLELLRRAHWSLCCAPRRSLSALSLRSGGEASGGKKGSVFTNQTALPQERTRAQKRSEANGRVRDCYEKIINLLEQGVVPWRRPWTSTGLPRNQVSKRPYNGINYFLLSASKYVLPFWLTYRQATELDGHVRKGEESTIVIFWKVEDLKQSGEDLDAEESNEKNRRRFLLRYYRVFNLEQCELPQAVLDKLPKIETHEHDPIEAAERIIAAMPNPPEIQYAGSKAFYSSVTDRITLPPRELFISAEEQIATTYHEVSLVSDGAAGHSRL